MNAFIHPLSYLLLADPFFFASEQLRGDRNPPLPRPSKPSFVVETNETVVTFFCLIELNRGVPPVPL